MDSTQEFDYAGHMTEAVAARLGVERKEGKKRTLVEVQNIIDLAKSVGGMMREGDVTTIKTTPDGDLTVEMEMRINSEVDRIFAIADLSSTPVVAKKGGAGDPAEIASVQRIEKMEEKQRLRNEQLAKKKAQKK